ncbi:AAA family ATPase, partial [Actinomadura miaoliensis]|uniref:AAA family ATPase n=1 Tax=Actinomadura miaoliensis TaxID=430685 RepID=UPI0031EBA9A2
MTSGHGMTFGHGLVIGKFYPPHAGHHHLIDTAAAACARLTVVVAASTVESIPLALRTAWLREAHPQPHVRVVPVVDDAEIDYGSDEVWALHVDAFRSGLALEPDAPPVDAVFSSEAYGDELARRFGAVHVPVDPPRERFPVSGTAVREDPVAAWPWLAPPVRAYLARRVVVVGAESSGTTTLARALAAHYAGRGGVWAATRWVPEYGRTYCEEKL